MSKRLLGTTSWLVISVAHTVDGDEEHRSLAPLLSVVNPSYHGHDSMHIRAVVHAVLPMEMDGCGVVTAEEIEGVDGLVLVTEESPHTLSLLVVDAAETQ